LTSTADNDALETLERLSDQLDTAKEASEAATRASEATTRASEATTRASEATTREVQHARLTTAKIKRDVRGKRPKPATAHGKSKAAVELGRKGGAARARQLSAQQRSAVARKAAKTRWDGHR
jgi:hypothetical protein